MKIKDRAKPKIPPVEPGVYMAICVGVIDLGEQYSDKFKTFANKVKIVFELVGETVEVDGEQKPRQLSKEFTISASKKANLRTFLQSWNTATYSDDEFNDLELFDQLGKPCQLTVVLNETKEYANIESIMGIPKGFPAPTTTTELIKWDMSQWDDEVFAKLPDWVQDQIKNSTEYKKDHAPDTTIEVKSGEDECPI